LDPANEAARVQLAQVYRKLGQADKAAEAAAAVKRLHTQTASVDRDRTGLEYRQGRTALERGRLSEAIVHLREALKGPADEAQIRTTLGVALMRKGDTTAAAGEFQRALEINPHAVDAYLNLGVLRMRGGDINGAEKEFRLALGDDPQFAEAHFNLGLAIAAQERWKEAADSLRTAIRLSPGNAYAWWNLGRVLRDSGDARAALDCYAKAWRLDRGLSEAALEYGKLLPPEKAKPVLREAVQRDALNVKLQRAYLSLFSDPEETDRERRRLALLNHGEFKAALKELDDGNYAAAIRGFAGILQAHPELDEVRRRLAFALFVNKQYSDAVSEYERLVGSHPDEVDLRLSLAVALRENSLFERARRELEEVIRQNPDSAQACYQLGLTWLAQKDTAQAMEQFRRARRLDPALRPPGG
jgi:tetratricopeptide (TPR) repeat protein